MPVYEYRCEQCDELHEVLRTIVDMDREYICPACDVACVRLIPTSFHGHVKVAATNVNTQAVQSSSKPHLNLTGSVLANGRVGVSIPQGMDLRMKGTKFKNVDRTIEIRKDTGDG